MLDNRIDKIKRFVQDPEWHIIEDILKEKLEKFKYIDEIDDKQTATEIKAQIKANKKAFNMLYTFLRETGMFKKDYQNKVIDYK
jgi:uncharacterized pyridoxal phosphate-containing UPF0001 family protein